MILKQVTTGSDGKEVQASIMNVVNKIEWSGAKTQVARALKFTITQDPRDYNLPVVNIECGSTIAGYDEAGTLVFRGNVYSIDLNTQGSSVDVACYDNLFILSKSKTTRKFTNAQPSDVVKVVCGEMGVKVGTLPDCSEQVTFIASQKTGYQIIMSAYTLASEKNGKQYQCTMVGDQLSIIEKGTLIQDFKASKLNNIYNSSYHESIENMVNRVRVVDEQGNTVRIQDKGEWQSKYGAIIQDVYKHNPKEQDEQKKIDALLVKPDRGGTIELRGDYRAVSGYSLEIYDVISQNTGKFWIKSDTHTFEQGTHMMKLEIEFENLMDKQTDIDKGDKKGA